MTAFVTVEARLKLEAVLLDRWGPKHGDACLRALERWCGWRWPTEQELLETVAHVSKPIRAARVGAAKAELPGMLELPPLTPTGDVPLLEQQIAFAVAPRSALVLPEERQLSPWHALAIVGRGLPMCQAVSRCIGGMWLRPVADLEQELQDREDEKAVRLLQLEQAAARARRESASRPGPRILAITW